MIFLELAGPGVGDKAYNAWN